MQLIRLSPSKLETFRKYYTGAYNGFITEQMVVDAIMGVKSPPSEKAMRGTAYHAMIENGPDLYMDLEEKKRNGVCGYKVFVNEGIHSKTFDFNSDQVEKIYHYRAEHPYIVHEISYTWEFEWCGYWIVIRMRIDAMDGLIVHDHKTSEEPHTLENYDESLQWIIYLMATETKRFRYNLIEFRDRKSGNTAEWMVYDLLYASFHKDRFFSFLDMYIRFCKDRNLMEYVSSDPRRQNNI